MPIQNGILVTRSIISVLNSASRTLTIELLLPCRAITVWRSNPIPLPIIIPLMAIFSLPRTRIARQGSAVLAFLGLPIVVHSKLVLLGPTTFSTTWRGLPILLSSSPKPRLLSTTTLTPLLLLTIRLNARRLTSLLIPTVLLTAWICTLINLLPPLTPKPQPTATHPTPAPKH